ncbi:MAG: substrate-binding domain-containing protein [Polyangiaceae bacterium]|nr:substrate-binding domain-containing protein [Polyangiaceae bacterium]
MKTILRGAFCVSALAFLAIGCGSDDDEAAENKAIDRVEVPESPFKPTEMEDTIEELLEAITAVPSDDFMISVITKPFGGYWEPVKKGANRAIGELGIQGQVEAPVDESDPDATTTEQIEMVKTRREEGYGGIGLAPMRDTVTDEVNLLVEAGVPVVTLDSDIPDSDRQLYVGTNNAEAGATGGQTLADLLPEGEGTVIILGATNEAWPDGYNRTMAASEALAAAGYTVTPYNVGWSDQEVETDMETLPVMFEDADPPIVGCLGVFSNAYRCADVASGLGMEPGDIKIAAFDFEPDTLDYMESGYIQATHVQRQYYMGYIVPYAIYSIRVLGFDATIDLLEDQMVADDAFDTGLDVIGSNQVEEYNDFLDLLGIGG